MIHYHKYSPERDLENVKSLLSKNNVGLPDNPMFCAFVAYDDDTLIAFICLSVNHFVECFVSVNPAASKVILLMLYGVAVHLGIKRLYFTSKNEELVEMLRRRIGINMYDETLYSVEI